VSKSKAPISMGKGILYELLFWKCILKPISSEAFLWWEIITYPFCRYDILCCLNHQMKWRKWQILMILWWILMYHTRDFAASFYCHLWHFSPRVMTCSSACKSLLSPSLNSLLSYISTFYFIHTNYDLHLTFEFSTAWFIKFIFLFFSLAYFCYVAFLNE
jgi:hypothetical protein